jgi:hypothetical protein
MNMALKKPEDIVSAGLVELMLAVPKVRVAVWRMLAPKRLREDRGSDLVESQGTLGVTKPDILWTKQGKPSLYVEVKVSAQTEPLQLQRARSWMKYMGCENDQVVLLAREDVELPISVGWTHAAHSTRVVLWHQVWSGLIPFTTNLAPAARTRLAGWMQLAASIIGSEALLARPSNKLKRDLSADSGLAYGKAMSEWLSSRPHWTGEFAFGARVSPRLVCGGSDWDRVFGTHDFQRLWLYYNLPRYAGFEGFAPQLILWHQQDYAHSGELASRNWPKWREIIENDGRFHFEGGRRQHTNRDRSGIMPRAFPGGLVGLVQLPESTRLPASRIAGQSSEQVARAIDQTVSPFIELVQALSSRT